MPNNHVIPIINLKLSYVRSTRNLSYDWIVNVMQSPHVSVVFQDLVMSIAAC